METIEYRMTDMQKNIDKLDKDIHGNGKNGIQQELSTLKMDVVQIKTQQDFMLRLTWGVITAVVGNLVGIAFMLVKTVGK